MLCVLGWTCRDAFCTKVNHLGCLVCLSYLSGPQKISHGLKNGSSGPQGMPCGPRMDQMDHMGWIACRKDALWISEWIKWTTKDALRTSVGH